MGLRCAVDLMWDKAVYGASAVPCLNWVFVWLHPFQQVNTDSDNNAKCEHLNCCFKTVAAIKNNNKERMVQKSLIHLLWALGKCDG